MTRAEEYRVEFNKLEAVLKKRANARSEDSISSVVATLVNTHMDRVVRQFERDIRQFIELRNAIIHQSTDRAIAEPYDETVAALRQLVINIEKPKTAWDIATKDLIKVHMDDQLSGVVKLMTQMHITSLPIVEGGAVIGFISESTIVKIIDNAFEASGALIDESAVKEVAYDPPYGDDSDIYVYVTRKVTVYEIEDMFNDAIKKGKRLLAVLVSDKGDASATPLGIITAWDLHKIDK
ncbi:MAG TPA: CBS domain-containing protein [Candidatus Saccharibacteria bacterium]|nr:CBS domain-containing protein [Candidatus Saccharibacteria bacterium]